jgi:hypothetical protein
MQNRNVPKANTTAFGGKQKDAVRSEHALNQSLIKMCYYYTYLYYNEKYKYKNEWTYLYYYYVMDEPMLPLPKQMNKLPNEFLMPVPFCELVCDQMCWAFCECGICLCCIN